ncbi:MAG: hypothetical protein HYS07_04145 [Chlamydiae bacterium]|nr:hypothetical protein [Chlamydiota bacterium]MBI3277390.1 hypothetical protein [Chlamydiota bacterium]
MKQELKTVRLTQQEEKEMNHFLKAHPYIRNFSTLVRASIWEFFKKHEYRLNKSEKPSFLWEYDLTHGEIVEILRGPQKNRLWLVGKIIEHGKWSEVESYLTLEQIAYDFPLLRLPSKIKEHWRYALERWGTPP